MHERLAAETVEFEDPPESLLTLARMTLQLAVILLTNRDFRQEVRRDFRQEFPYGARLFAALSLCSAAGGLAGVALTSATGHVKLTLLVTVLVMLAGAGGVGSGPLLALQRARGRHRRIRIGLAGLSAQSLTALAASLAGRGGLALLWESDAHLAGESGHDVANLAKVKQAAGFVRAGVRYRLSDWADAAWRPTDAVLRSRLLSGLFVAIPTIVVAFEVLTHKGTMTLLTSLGPIFGTWTFLAGAIKAGRKYRDVHPPAPKARRSGD